MKEMIETKQTKNMTISVFKKYARLGLHLRELSPFEVYRVIGGCCASERSRLDLLAVYDTLRLLELNGEKETLAAVRDIYFATARHRMRKSEISRRITRFAFENYCDERTVYRRLLSARRYYEHIREREYVQKNAADDDHFEHI